MKPPKDYDMLNAWKAIVQHCAKLSESEQQAADDELYDHVDPYF